MLTKVKNKNENENKNKNATKKHDGRGGEVEPRVKSAPAAPNPPEGLGLMEP